MLVSVSDAPRSDTVTERLMALIDQQAPMREVASVLFNEYRLLERFNEIPASKHPQGFLTFKLAITDDQSKALRLHVWLPHKREVADQKGFEIHDHVFGFTSALLSGVTNNQCFNVTPSPTETGMRMFPVTYTAVNEDTITSDPQPVAVQRSSSEHYAAGQYYVMPAGVYHTSVVPEDSFTITLLSVRSGELPFPRMIGPANLPLPGVNRRPRPDAGDMPLIIKRLGEIRHGFV